MAALLSKLQSADRPDVIRDTVHLIDEEVSKKSGLSGAALKAGYKVVKKLQSGRMINKAVDYLLDDFAQALDPLYQEYLSDGETEGAGTKTFEGFLDTHQARAADALLAITDGRIGTAENRVVQKTYGKLRTQAHKHVCEAVSGVGRIIDTHVPKPTAA